MDATDATRLSLFTGKRYSGCLRHNGEVALIALRLTLFGGFEARLGAGGILNLPTRKAQALLAYLAVRPGECHLRDKLAALLWGEKSDEQARDGLRHALATLRNALPRGKASVLRIEGQSLALDPAAVEVDVVTFERRVADGSRRALERAHALYRGDLLAGFGLDEPVFEEWLRAERARLRERALEALGALLAYQAKTESVEPAIRTALRLLELEPSHEVAHRTLMRLYVRQGRRGAALKQYQVCVGVLQRELETEPEVETKRLYEELLRRPATSPKPRGRSGRFRGGPTVTTRLDLPAVETPLVGRQKELERLRRLLGAILHGRGQVGILAGEAGIGKTRLLSALAAEASEQGCRVLVGRAYESDSILPFGPWVDALRRSGVSANEEILGRLKSAWRAELTRLFPEASAAALPPPSDGHLRLFESIGRLLEEVAARQPVLLVLEDLQWGDEISLRLLAFVSRRVPETRTLVMVSVREEELVDASAARGAVRELCRLPQTTQLTLSPLSRSDTVLLVRSLAGGWGDARTVARLNQHVWEVSEGNPFVAVETTRALQQGVLPPDSAVLPLPQRVRDLVTHRLDQLTEQARQLVVVAAVIGREFEFGLLQSASGLDAEPAATAVEELVRRRVLQGIGERFDFTHERIRAVVRDQVLNPRRKLLERRVGEAIEAVYAADIESHTLSLGLHYLRGEVWDRAVIFLERAGLSAAGRSAYREAVACFDQAMGALGHLPGGPDTARRAIDLRLDLHSVHAVLGNVDQMFSLLREAEPIAAGLGDRRLEACVASQMALCLWWTGQPVLAVGTGQRALSMAEALRDVELEAVTRARLAFACMDLGDYQRAVELYQKNVRVLVGDLARARFDMSAVPGVTSRGFLATCLAILGDFGRAGARMDEALEIAEATAHPYTVAWAHTEAGRLRALKGDWEAAIEWLERSLELCRRDGFAYLFPNAATFLGHAYTRCGRIPEGIALLEEAVEQSATIRYMASHPRGAAHLAEGYLLAGRLRDAMQAGRGALELSRRNGQRGFEAEVLRILGDVEMSRDDPDDEGRARFREALALSRDLGMRPLEARCYLGLGRLLRRAGDGEAARVLSRARAMFTEMEMGFWLEQVEAELVVTGDRSRP